MSEAMSLEEYKKQVETCLIENCNFSEAAAKSRMQLYEEDFPEFIEMQFTPAEAAVGMAMMLL